MSTETATTARPEPVAHRLGRVEDIPPGEGRAFAVAGEQIAVFRVRDGRLFAMQAICPHQGGPLADGQVDGHAVVCPLHAHSFELDGGRCLTGQSPVTTYPVTEVDGEILVHVERHQAQM